MRKNSVIRIRGARTNNLKNINVDIKKNALVVITGVSGSGKSSLAFDTIFAEGQRRYMESLTATARQFISLPTRPEVDFIDGLTPAIALEQKIQINRYPDPEDNDDDIIEDYWDKENEISLYDLFKH